ncbi:MAG: CcmD family protein [Gemmatimonadaceae bacterium]
MRDWPVVIAAYAITWIVLGGYAYYLWRRGRRAAAASESLLQ